MKFKAKKLTSLALASLLGVSALALGACGGKKDAADSETDLQIFYWNSGNGDVWLNKTVKEFNKVYPNVKVSIESTADNSTWEKSLTAPSTNTIDLYISTMANFLAYTEYIEPLDDIFYEDGDVDGDELVWEGESKSLLEKQNHTILNAQRGPDGQLYAAMWGGGVCGIIYNATKFEGAIDEGEIECMPRTTDELAEVAAIIKDVYGQIPFMHCNNADYWNYGTLTWYGQYSGTDGVTNMWNTIYVDEDGEEHELDSRSYLDDGKRLALEALYECIAPAGNTWSGSNTKKHTAAQTEFLNGRAWMMPNGSWLENEMKGESRNNDDVFLLMKTPIISAIIDQLDTVDDDDTLREVIDYVDGVTDEAPAGVSEDDIERVRTARNVAYTEGASNRCIVPNYATAKDYAKKFIQFMQTDTVLNIYAEETGQFTTVNSTDPIDYEEEWTDFAISCGNLMGSNADYVFRNKSHPMFYNSGVFAEAFPANPYAQQAFTASGSDKYDSAEAFWNWHETWVENNWESSLKIAGLK